jgi:hypothetical protein
MRATFLAHIILIDLYLAKFENSEISHYEIYFMLYVRYKFSSQNFQISRYFNNSAYFSLTIMFRSLGPVPIVTANSPIFV